MKKYKRISLAIVFCAVLGAVVFGQTTEFTYQGQLQNASAPANGTYDFEFVLYDASTAGTQVGSTLTRNGVAVASGVFSVKLDFGSSFPGSGRFLEIRVRETGTGAFTALTPRQSVTSAPYSVKSLSSDNATNAINATTAVNATNAASAVNFSGALSGDVTGTQGSTSVTRLQGRDLAITAPINGQVIKFSSANNRWEPDTDTAGTGSGGGTITGVSAGPGLAGGGTSGNVTVSIATGGVFTQHLLDGAVTDVKINSVSGGKVTGSVANATNAATAANATQLGGIAAAQYVQTGDSRLSDARAPTPNSSNYIQNSPIGTQLSSSFNISGTGRASIFSAATQYNIGGDRVLGNAGESSNIFVGLNAGLSSGPQAGNNSFVGTSAGKSNTSGGLNSFFGYTAGESNTGSGNSFVGSAAGRFSTGGGSNSFFGWGAGASNTMGGSNSFFGVSAGSSNTGGTNNTIIGTFADVNSGDLVYATAIGSGASVANNNTIVLGRDIGADTVQIPGNLNVTGTLSANINGSGITSLNASNIATGTLNNARLGVVPIANGGTGSATQNFVDLTNAQTIGGNKTFSNTLSGNIVNTATQYNIGNNRVLSVGEFGNTSLGIDTGFTSPSSASDNSFFGAAAGRFNAGRRNSYFGSSAGGTASAGNDNSAFGASSGGSNTTGSANAFFGNRSGISNTTGSLNSFFGDGAGFHNSTGTKNTIIGNSATVGSGNLSNATAIGANAIVSQNDSLVLGSINGVNGATSHTNVGIGTSAPAFKLQVVDASNTGLRVQNNVAGGTVASFGGTGAFQIDAPGTAGGRLTIGENGNVGIGNPTPNDKLNVFGNVSFFLASAGATSVCQNASFQISTCGSSVRYKQNINPFLSGLSLIKQLRPVSFNWLANGQTDMGLVAEEVAAVEPLLTTTNAKGEVEGVKYDRVGVVLVNAVQEQQLQIEAQQKQIDEQRSIIANQRSDLNMLKAMVCSGRKRNSACK